MIVKVCLFVCYDSDLHSSYDVTTVCVCVCVLVYVRVPCVFDYVAPYVV